MSWSMNPFQHMIISTNEKDAYRWECDNCGAQSKKNWKGITQIQIMREDFLIHLLMSHRLSPTNRPDWMKE